MNKLCLLAAFLLFVLPLFAHNAGIEIKGENRYKSVRLAPPVYNGSYNRLADLLIKNSSGDTVPYFINSNQNETNIRHETMFIETFFPRFTVKSENKKTKIDIAGLKNLRLCDLVIETDSMFIRNVYAPGGIKKELFHLAINDEVSSDTTLPLNRLIAWDETYTLVIDDADDRPINIKSIAVRYYADDLVFEGQAGETYTLEFGIDSVKAAPVYDISRYKNEILKGPIDKVSLGEIRYTETPPERKFVINKTVFNIVVILVAILLGALIVFRLKK
ncbi:MAG: hypothetical protein LBH97_03510 [Treponema sp.]|jgi:hypothetical protein|nr:hypothetical protein [Treponema sp.]